MRKNHIIEHRLGLTHPFGAGHGLDYYLLPDGSPNNAYLATEAFADMFSAEISNRESLEAIKELLPESYSIFKEMLEAII